MSKLGTITLTGASRQEYEFEIYPWGTDFKPVAAVYSITSRSQKQNGWTHDILYVGETEDVSERFDNHHKVSCFTNHNVNCVCIRVENSRPSRLAIERDLIGAYDPTCND